MAWGAVEVIVLPAGVVVGQAGELGVEGHGAKNAVEGKLVLADQVDPIRGKRRDAAPAGEGIAAGHVVARRHLHEEVLDVIFFEGLERAKSSEKTMRPSRISLRDLMRSKSW
jgi:hypothetical protein